MKKYLIVFILILILFIIDIPEYVELNNLIIVDSIGISCNNEVNLYVKEIIPIRDDNGIEYDYKIYKSTGNNLDISYKNFVKNRNVFTKDIKKIYTNCNINDVSKYFNISKSKIHKSNNIIKELR